MDGLEKWWAFALPIAEKWWPIGLLPAAWLVWWLWWRLPKREVAKLRYFSNPIDRVDVEDTLRKPIGQAIGGVVVLIGVGVALAQFLEQRDAAQKQIAVSQDQVRISQQQVQASHDLLISNQIAKGFEQLGSDKIEVRLGGIYALEGILNMPPPDKTSPNYRQPVLEALCAFVRDHTIGKPVADHPTTDVQAVLTVIGRRPKELKLVDLRGANLDRANLFDAYLSSARLSGANLNDVNLDGANLSHANLLGAHLSDAYLRDADLSGANLADANLNDAHLNGASLIRALLIHAHLNGADLNDANLNDADLSYAYLTDGDLSGANLATANLNNADLSDADLSRANLTGAHLDNQEQLSKACGKPKALPEGFTLDRPCPLFRIHIVRPHQRE